MRVFGALRCVNKLLLLLLRVTVRRVRDYGADEEGVVPVVGRGRDHCQGTVRIIRLARTVQTLKRSSTNKLQNYSHLYDLDITRQIDHLVPILYDSAHVAGWEPLMPHDLPHVCWVRYVLCRSCSTSRNSR